MSSGKRRNSGSSQGKLKFQKKDDSPEWIRTITSWFLDLVVRLLYFPVCNLIPRFNQSHMTVHSKWHSVESTTYYENISLCSGFAFHVMLRQSH